jgi:hypothetical protein
MAAAAAATHLADRADGPGIRDQDQAAACRSGRLPSALPAPASGLARPADSVIRAVWILSVRWSGIGGTVVLASSAGTIARSSRTSAH